ncbi:hypothetical protein GQ55_7G025000 [Panicum hallii var. hallii]|uniref:Uncharacterized protein n=1 Tax=Panicum hallii var. hallii TaxID=1504633 RepID=A0A2T7CS36_9POAL|nr:hypothetical protein GQ55_7G025000 [Panicum hallii var. hallii]
MYYLMIVMSEGLFQQLAEWRDCKLNSELRWGRVAAAQASQVAACKIGERVETSMHLDWKSMHGSDIGGSKKLLQ